MLRIIKNRCNDDLFFKLYVKFKYETSKNSSKQSFQ